MEILTIIKESFHPIPLYLYLTALNSIKSRFLYFPRHRTSRHSLLITLSVTHRATNSVHSKRRKPRSRRRLVCYPNLITTDKALIALGACNKRRLHGWLPKITGGSAGVVCAAGGIPVGSGT